MLAKLVKTYGQLRQWHTTRKIVVFESDDWGSSRMPDQATFKRLASSLPQLSKDHYANFDCIANTEDFEQLFAVLEKYKDGKNNHPVITANAIMANPDFKKIAESGFNEYHYEPFYKTIQALPDGNNILECWNYGISKNIFIPQLHGREHLLVPVWMYELKAGNKALLSAFKEGVYGGPCTSAVYSKRNNLQAAFDYSKINGNDNWHKKAILESSRIFNEYFGFQSKSFIAPAYIWNRQIESTLAQEGIQYIQGLPIQYEPGFDGRKYNKRFHFTGQKNSYGQFYIVRNAFFEPSSNATYDWFNDCLGRVEKAFANKCPAIVGIHRVNFIGSLVESNRRINIELFDKLLAAIITKWPDVEFMSTDQLGDAITNS
jgi:hypothetical protein